MLGIVVFYIKEISGRMGDFHSTHNGVTSQRLLQLTLSFSYLLFFLSPLLRAVSRLVSE